MQIIFLLTKQTSICTPGKHGNKFFKNSHICYFKIMDHAKLINKRFVLDLTIRKNLYQRGQYYCLHDAIKQILKRCCYCKNVALKGAKILASRNSTQINRTRKLKSIKKIKSLMMSLLSRQGSSKPVVVQI